MYRNADSSGVVIAFPFLVSPQRCRGGGGGGPTAQVQGTDAHAPLIPAQSDAGASVPRSRGSHVAITLRV